MGWVFVSKHKNYQIWLKRPVEEFTIDGRLKLRDPGILVEFVGGYYETDNEEIAEMLMNSPDFGIVFNLYENKPVDESQFKESALNRLTPSATPKVTSYVCDQCGKEFPSMYKLNKHKREEHTLREGSGDVNDSGEAL